MSTVRVYKVAELLNTTSNEVLELLKKNHGIELKSASSTIEEVVARSFVERLARQRNISLPGGDMFAEHATPAKAAKKKKKEEEIAQEAFDFLEPSGTYHKPPLALLDHEGEAARPVDRDTLTMQARILEHVARGSPLPAVAAQGLGDLANEAQRYVYHRLNGMNPEGMVAEISAVRRKDALYRVLSIPQGVDVPRLATGIAGVMSKKEADTVAALGGVPARAADYFAEEVRRELLALYGEDQLYGGGLSVRTSLDPNLQILARQTLMHGLIEFDEAAKIFTNPAKKATEDYITGRYG